MTRIKSPATRTRVTHDAARGFAITSGYEARGFRAFSSFAFLLRPLDRYLLDRHPFAVISIESHRVPFDPTRIRRLSVIRELPSFFLVEDNADLSRRDISL